MVYLTLTLNPRVISSRQRHGMAITCLLGFVNATLSAGILFLLAFAAHYGWALGGSF